MSRQKLMAILIAGVIGVTGLYGCANESFSQQEPEQEEEFDIDFIKKKKLKPSGFIGLGSSSKGSVSS